MWGAMERAHDELGHEWDIFELCHGPNEYLPKTMGSVYTCSRWCASKYMFISGARENPDFVFWEFLLYNFSSDFQHGH